MNSFPSNPTQTAGSAVATHARAHDDGGISCGEFLRRARERRGLTLQQIAEATKIPLRHLSALERDEFAALPSGMYRRAEVRAYADAVGLDRGVALASLDRALEQAMPRTAAGVQASAPPPRVASGRRTLLLLTAGVAVITGAIAFATLARQPRAVDSTSLAAPVPQPTSSVVAAPDAPNHVLVATSGSSARPTGAPPMQGAEPATAPPASLAQPRMERSDPAIAAASRVEPRLTVITEPAGARLTVNGVGWGITPVTIRYLPPGAKRVRVTREGYLADERVIQIEAGGPATTLRIPMQAQGAGDGSSPVVLTESDGTRNSSRSSVVFATPEVR